MSGPIIDLRTGEIIIPDPDLSPEENEFRRKKLLQLDEASKGYKDGELE